MFCFALQDREPNAKVCVMWISAGKKWEWHTKDEGLCAHSGKRDGAIHCTVAIFWESLNEEVCRLLFDSQNPSRLLLVRSADGLVARP